MYRYTTLVTSDFTRPHVLGVTDTLEAAKALAYARIDRLGDMVDYADDSDDPESAWLEYDEPDTDDERIGHAWWLYCPAVDTHYLIQRHEVQVPLTTPTEATE